MKNIFKIFVPFLLMASSSLTAKDTKVVKIRPDRFDIRVHTGKKEKKLSNSNDRNCTVTLSIKITNKNRADISDYSAKLYTYVGYSKSKYLITLVHTFDDDFSIPAGKSISLEKKIFNFTYHKHSGCPNDEHGYSSYLLVITDDQDKQFLVKSSTSKLIKHLDKVLDMKSSRRFDLKKGHVIN
ncbi:MAG: hypothetical protein HRT88_10115 [Lentisphaeraceae bacterium]|nr:hypothetical protein [Lentisphaeraceae bacterium]